MTYAFTAFRWDMDADNVLKTKTENGADLRHHRQLYRVWLHQVTIR